MLARGFSLIEMLIVIAIAGIVLAIAVPSFQETIVNGRSRGVAESIQFGLIKARSDAISRNAPMRFQLVSTLDATCTASSTSRLWVVTQYTGPDRPGQYPWRPGRRLQHRRLRAAGPGGTLPGDSCLHGEYRRHPAHRGQLRCRPLHFLQERGGPRSRHYRHGNADHGHPLGIHRHLRGARAVGSQPRRRRADRHAGLFRAGCPRDRRHRSQLLRAGQFQWHHATVPSGLSLHLVDRV
ncbi:MAG: prepilin-type N-terminal cleavage/methylation domain-containing protein [Sulfuritalea sp.]|nr:prepilin-type N-terminal cleavage/methylation domain-containing protein [Sulfuritalea sp.]